MPTRRNIVLLIAACALLIWVSGIGCFFRYFFGISCAGCGMTRACLSAILPLHLVVDLSSTPDVSLPWTTALRLRLQQMWHYHPMVFVTVPLMIYAFFAKKPMFGSQKREIMVLFAVCALFLVVWAVRLWQGSAVVACDPSSGVLTGWIFRLT